MNTYGPRIAIQSAAILIFIGLFCMWLSVDDAMPTSVGVLCLFTCLLFACFAYVCSFFVVC